jgi:hypothetical protein
VPGQCEAKVLSGSIDSKVRRWAQVSKNSALNRQARLRDAVRERAREGEPTSAEISLAETYRSLTPWGRSIRPHSLAAESQANREGEAESESESDSRRAGP